MPDTSKSFQWTGINPQGGRVSGVLKAADAKEAQLSLKKLGIEVITMQPKQGVELGKFNLLPRKKKIKSKDILLFTRFLSTMLSAGLPLVQALDIIGRDQENDELKSLLTSLKNNVAGGHALGESFSQFPDSFDDLYCNLIRAGEKSGTLDKTLKRLALYLEKSELLKSKIKKALVYPAVIITVAMIVSLILLLFVVPQFQKMFKSFGGQLPAFTMLVVHLSQFLRSYWWLVIACIVGIVWAIRSAMRKNKSLQQKIDHYILKIPIIGLILRKGIIARYTRTLATTLEAGMPIVESMKAMAPVMGNSVYSKGIMQISDEVASGHPLAASMVSTKLFPTMATQMIGVGEASGALSDMLHKVADYYEEEVNTIVDNLSNLLEPLIMIVLGVVIGGFVIAMYLPIFKMGSLF